MSQIIVNVPDGEKGDWRIETFGVSREDSTFTAIRASVKGAGEYVPEGQYKRLMRGRTVVMSNTPMEVRTHYPLIVNARGHVLLNGLGLGMALTAVLAKPEVKSVTVVEISPEVIDLVSPTFSSDKRVQIIEGDALRFKPKNVMRYDVVWHDIWDYITSDNLPEMKTLHRRYGRKSNWQGSWCRYQCEQAAKRDRGYWR